MISNKNKQKSDHKIRVQERLVASSQSKSYEFSRISSDTTAVRKEAHDSNSRRFSVHMFTLEIKCIFLRDSGYSGDFGFIINK